MKFVCERCHTRYSIADDKVRQKILKIRCKTCENVITVRDPASSVIEPAVSVAQPPPPPARGTTPAPVAAREWFVAVNGDQVGPVSRTEAAKRISEIQPDDEVYIWKEGLDGWKPPSEVPAIQQELNALKARSAPPPRAPGRTTVPPPARSAPAKASHAAAARSAPAAAPVAQANPFGDEDHTQIQPFDAGMLAPDLMARSASAPAAVLPFKGRATNGAAPAPVPASANLDGLFSDLPPAAAPLGAGAGNFVPAPASLHAHTRSDSGLSRLTGFAGFMSRNPGLKFVAAGAVVVVLIALVVIVLVRMPGDPKPLPPPVAVEKTEPPPPIDILPGRLPEEKPVTKSVGGTTASVSKGPSIGASRGTGKGRNATKAVRPPGQVQPGSLEPAPIEPNGVSPGPGRVAAGERPVATYKSNRQDKPETTASSGPTDGQIHGVVNRRENQLTIKACYERALKRDDNIRSGRIETTVDIAPSGIVKSVVLNAPPQFGGVEPCIKQAVRRWMFPASGEGYSTQFTLIMQGNQ